MRLEISTSQLLNLRKGKSINLSSSQLKGTAKKGKVHEIEIDDSNTKALTLAKNKGKGYRVTASDVITSGSGLFSSISKGVKKATKSVSKAVSDTANKVADVAEDVGKTAYKGALSADLGGMVESAKNVVPKSVVETAVTTGITAALVARGMPPEEAEKVASTMSAVAVTGLYEYDFGEAPSEANAKQASIKAAKAGAKSAMKGGAVSNKGLGHHAKDNVKTPAYSGGLVTNKVPTITGRPASKGGSMVALHSSKGGSFKPLSSGGSMVALQSKGGSIVPVGSGAKRPKLIKGSAESKAWGQRMRDAREKKKK